MPSEFGSVRACHFLEIEILNKAINDSLDAIPHMHVSGLLIIT